MSTQAFTLAVMLARVCVSEAGFNGHEECTVIVHALIAQAHRADVPLRSHICNYAPNSCDQDRQDRRRWIAHLHPERRRAPPGWPRLSWSRYRAQFASMVVVAYEASIGAIPSACPGSMHWGSHWCRRCRERMLNNGFERAGCGLRNAWWRRAQEE